MMTELLAEKKPKAGLFARAYEFVTGRQLPERTFTHDLGGAEVRFGRKDLSFWLPEGLKIISRSSRPLRVDTKGDLYREIRKAVGLRFEGNGVYVNIPIDKKKDVHTTIVHHDHLLPKLLEIFVESHDRHVMVRSKDDVYGIAVNFKNKQHIVDQVRFKERHRKVFFHKASSDKSNRVRAVSVEKHVTTRPLRASEHVRTAPFSMSLDIIGD